MTLLMKIEMEKITSKNTKRALRNRNANKTTVFLKQDRRQRVGQWCLSLPFL